MLQSNICLVRQTGMVLLAVQARDGARLVVESTGFGLYGTLPFGTEQNIMMVWGEKSGTLFLKSLYSTVDHSLFLLVLYS